MEVYTFGSPESICQHAFPGEYVVIIDQSFNTLQRQFVGKLVKEVTGRELETPEKIYLRCGKDKKTAYRVFDTFNREECPFVQLFGPYPLDGVGFPSRHLMEERYGDSLEKGIILCHAN